MEGLAEAIKLIQDTAVGGIKPMVFEVPGVNRKKFLFNPDTKETREFDVDNPLRNHNLKSLDNLITMAGHAASIDQLPVIWHDENVVKLCFDDTTRRDFATFLLTPDPRYVLTKSLSNKWYDQKGIVKLLRVDLRGALVDPTLPSNLSKLKFTKLEETDGDLGKSKESIGKSIETEIKAEAEIPEELTLQLEMYSNYSTGGGFPVRCALVTDLSTQKFQIVPYPGELEHLVQSTHMALQAQLEAMLGADTKVTVYFGSV